MELMKSNIEKRVGFINRYSKRFGDIASWYVAYH